MFRWLARRKRLHELAPLCESAAYGHTRSVQALYRHCLQEPDLWQVLQMLADAEARNEVARLWSEARDPRLGAILRTWNFMPAEPPALRFRVAVYLDRRDILQEGREIYLPLWLEEPAVWHWELPPSWNEQLFQMFLHGQLPSRFELRKLPDDLASRAVYLLLTDQLDELQALDFDGAWLARAYETSGAGVRSRMLAVLRRTGQSELAVRLTGRREDLTRPEWETRFELLKQDGKHQELWELVPQLPPVWAAQVLTFLRAQGFVPSEREPYQQLLDALPDDLRLAPQHVSSHPGLPMTWLTPRELLLSGHQLCHVDRKTVEPIAVRNARNWRISPDGTRLAVIDSTPNWHGDPIYSLYLLTRDPSLAPVLEHRTQAVSASMAFSPDSLWLATLENNVLRHFSVHGGVPQWELPLTGCSRIQFLNNDELICLGPAGYRLVRGGRVVWSLPGLSRAHVRQNNEGQLLFFGDSRHLHVVDRETGALIGSPSASEQVLDAVFAPGASVMAAGLTRLERLDIGSGLPLFSYPGAHGRPARFAPDGFRLARGRGRHLELIDTFEGTRTGLLNLAGPVTEVDFSPDGLLLAVGMAGRHTYIFAVPPSTSVRAMSADDLAELERLATVSPAWGFLAALARFRMRFALTLEDWVLGGDDAFLIEVE